MRVVAIAFLRAANFASVTHVLPYREYVMDKQFTVVRRYLPCIRACIMHTEIMHRDWFPAGALAHRPTSHLIPVSSVSPSISVAIVNQEYLTAEVINDNEREGIVSQRGVCQSIFLRLLALEKNFELGVSNETIERAERVGVEWYNDQDGYCKVEGSEVARKKSFSNLSLVVRKIQITGGTWDARQAAYSNVSAKRLHWLKTTG